eukprot:109095-Rhodomonas_salina.2
MANSSGNSGLMRKRLDQGSTRRPEALACACAGRWKPCFRHTEAKMPDPSATLKAAPISAAASLPPTAEPELEW